MASVDAEGKYIPSAYKQHMSNRTDNQYHVIYTLGSVTNTMCYGSLHIFNACIARKSVYAIHVYIYLSIYMYAITCKMYRQL